MDPDAARSLTVNVLVAAAALLLLYDLVIVYAAGPAASISVAAAVGLVVGHVLWPVRSP